MKRIGNFSRKDVSLMAVAVVVFFGFCHCTRGKLVGSKVRDQGEDTPAPEPSSRGIPSPASDQGWPQIREGHYVFWVDRVWNTRKLPKLWCDGDIGTLGQRNGTATYLGENRVNRGTVEFDVKFDAGYLATGGGGKHFLEIMSWVADRSDRQVIKAQPWSRIELANLGDSPRCLVWNYGSHFRGRATKIFRVGPAFQPDRWYHIKFDWSYRPPSGNIIIHIDNRSYESSFEFLPGTVGPGRFFIFGHVETPQPAGCLHFRSFRVDHGAKSVIRSGRR